MPEVTVESEELQKLLEQINGVLTAQPVLNSSGQVAEIHILATAARNPKQIVRDVETACKAQFDLELDHKTISVVQLNAADTNYSPARLFLQTIQLANTAGGSVVTVKLHSHKGDSYEGSASGPSTTGNLLKIAARAGLAAAETYLHDLCQFILNDVVPITIGNHSAILVSITLVTPQGEEELIGSALVNSEASEAVVRALLNAINRRVGLMTH